MVKPDDSSEPNAGQATVFQFKIAAALYTLMFAVLRLCGSDIEVDLALKSWTDMPDF